MVLGLGGAVLAGRIAFGTSRFGATPTQAVFWIIASGMLGFAISFTTILLPAWRDVRGLTVRETQVTITNPRPPLWSRIYLDFIMLAGGGIIFWQSMRNAYQVVLAPEGVPTISINYLTLLAPFMLWIGFALLAWRLSNLTLAQWKAILASSCIPDRPRIVRGGDGIDVKATKSAIKGACHYGAGHLIRRHGCGV